MKKIKTLVTAAVVLLCVILPLTACGTSETLKTKYVITAAYDEEKRQVDATLVVDYVNTSDSGVGEVMFHLYPRAFREGAKFTPVSTFDRADAYPSGVSYGDLTVLKVKRDGQEVDIEIVGEDEDILRVGGSLMPNESTKIEIEFMLDLPHIRHRFGHHDGIVNLGNWYPIACIIKDGTFDLTPYYTNGDPFNSDISDYEINITVPQKYKVATSGRQTESVSGGLKTVSAKLVNARDVAVVIGEFKVMTETVDGVEINYYYINDDAAAAHLKTVVDSVEFFSETFGDYVYDTLSVVKNPFLYGGMEYPALVYISDVLNESLFKEVIIHEVAHQWWYAAVGNDQVREAWLDEGMAEYSTTLFYENYADYGVSKQARLSGALAGYILYCEDNFKCDTSMNRSAPQYKDQREYSCMTYVKGQMLLDAVRDSIGDRAFFAGLRDYYKANKFKRATRDDLIGALENSSKVKLKSFVDSWVEGKAQLAMN